MSDENYTKLQWAVWGTGLVVGPVVLVAAAFAKGGPEWYWLACFLPAAAYILLSQAAFLFVRFRLPESPSRTSWLSALSTSRLGLVGLLAVAIVIALLVVFRVGQ